MGCLQMQRSWLLSWNGLLLPTRDYLRWIGSCRRIDRPICGRRVDWGLLRSSLRAVFPCLVGSFISFSWMISWTREKRTNFLLGYAHSCWRRFFYLYRPLGSPQRHFTLCLFCSLSMVFFFLLVSLFLSFLCLFHRSVSYFALWQNRRLSSKHIDPRIGSWQDLKLSQPGRLQILGLPLSLKSEGQLHVGIPSKRWEKRMTLVRIENRRRRERGLIGTCSTRTPV